MESVLVVGSCGLAVRGCRYDGLRAYKTVSLLKRQASHQKPASALRLVTSQLQDASGSALLAAGHEPKA
jgi:hypothetical protein